MAKINTKSISGTSIYILADLQKQIISLWWSCVMLAWQWKELIFESWKSVLSPFQIFYCMFSQFLSYERILKENKWSNNKK